MAKTLTTVATLTLPIVVVGFGDEGRGYSYEIGTLILDSGFDSFDAAAGAARKAAEVLEQRILADYAGAESTITTDRLQPGSIKALIDALEAQEVFETHAVDCDGCSEGSHCEAGQELSLTAQTLREAALAPFKPAPAPAALTPITPDGLADMLLLIDEEYPLDVIAGWTQEQRDQAEEWAAAVCLDANDNDVEVPPKPEFMTR